jgi:hypothetical protein
MRSNPIEPLMAGCAEANLAVEDWRKGCRMWLWIEPLPSRGGKKPKGLAKSRCVLIALCQLDRTTPERMPPLNLSTSRAI